MGASTAFHLAVAGVRDVVLLERETLASGSTSRSAGGARLQFADELNVQLSLRSLEEFEHWNSLIGEHVSFVPDLAFRQVGYLFLLDTPELVETFRAALAVQHAHGVPSRELTPSETLEMIPQLELDGVLAATFCPRDGHMSPEAVVQGYAAAAAALGTQVVQGCPATGIEQAGGRITGVRTERGTIATDTVVCTAGAWSREVGAMLDLEIPVHGEPRHMWFSPESGGLRGDLPLTIDFSTSFYFHSEGPGIVFGGREAELEDVAEHALAAHAADRRAPHPEQLVGVLRGEPRPQRDRRRVVRRPGPLSLRDGVLGSRLPAVAGHRRAPREARPRRGDGTRSRRLRPRALRARRAARRAVRGLGAAREKTSDRATAVSSTPPTYRFPEGNLYLGEASTYFGDARCATEAM